MIKSAFIINSLCFIIPAFILVIPGIAEVSFPILALWGLVYCYQQSINPFQHPQSKILALLCSSYFLVGLISILSADISLYAFKRLGTNYHFLVAPFLSVLLAQYLNLTVLHYAIKTGAILAGLVAIVQYFYLDMPDLRAEGAVNAIIFGDLAILLAFCALLRLFKENKWQRLVSLLSFTLGTVAMILSLSRGAWICFPVLISVLLVIWSRQGLISSQRLIKLAILSSALILSLSLLPQVKQRAIDVVHDISVYENNRYTSVGVRLTLWQASLVTIPNHFFLGYGLHNAKQAMKDYFTHDKSAEKLQAFGHFHNEYLTTLVTRGMLGLIALLSLLFIPVFIFLKQLTSTHHLYLSSLGLMLCIAYAFFGLTNIALGHGILNTFFAFMLVVSSPILRPSYNL